MVRYGAAAHTLCKGTFFFVDIVIFSCLFCIFTFGFRGVFVLLLHNKAGTLRFSGSIPAVWV